MFSLVFRGLGGEHMVEEALKNVPGGAFGAMLAVMAVMFVLGFFLDTFEIILIMLPICGPPLIILGLDPVWLGVMIAINLQTSFLTPPFGFTLFYLRSIAPPSMTTATIWLGAIPYVTMQIFVLGVVWAFPPTATWLPKALFQAARPSITTPATPAKAGTSSPAGSNDIQGGKTRFNEDGVPIEGDDPMGFSKSQGGAKPKFDKDGIPIEDDDPMAFTKRK
jgi:hypothetical protein